MRIIEIRLKTNKNKYSLFNEVVPMSKKHNIIKMLLKLKWWEKQHSCVPLLTKRM